MDKLLKVIAEQNEEAECCFQLKRIADALDTVINMVKEDQERTRKYMEQPEEGDMRDHFKKAVVDE